MKFGFSPMKDEDFSVFLKWQKIIQKITEISLLLEISFRLTRFIVYLKSN
jgi:hypothetical protein